MALLLCRVIVNALGVSQYIPYALEDKGKSKKIDNGDIVVFNVFPKGDKIDMRAKAPFYQIIPCPYCGTNDAQTRQHKAY